MNALTSTQATEIVQASSLNLDPEPLIAFALADVAEATRRAYTGRLWEFISWLEGRPITYVSVMAYKAELLDAGAKPATINQSLSAIKRFCRQMRNARKMDRDEVVAIGEIPGEHYRGQRTHSWLSRDEIVLLLDAPDDDARGWRDRATLALLVGCALRRSEAAALRWRDIERRGSTVVLANLVGKHRKIRTIPAPGWAVETLTRWRETAEAHARPGAAPTEDSLVLRRVGRWGHVWNGGITTQAIYNIIKQHGAAIGLPELAPHDLRRTWAQNAYRSSDRPDRLVQIQLILGHESLTTTERYLGLKNVDLDNPLTLEVGY